MGGKPSKGTPADMRLKMNKKKHGSIKSRNKTRENDKRDRLFKKKVGEV